MSDDHRIAALKVLGTDDPRNPSAAVVNLEAVAHATLYVGDQLARIADVLEGARADDGASLAVKAVVDG